MELNRKVRDFALPERIATSKDNFGASFQKCVLEHIRETILLYIHRSFFAQAIIEHPANPLKSTYTPSFLAAYRAWSTILKSIREQFSVWPNASARFWTMWTFGFSAAVVFGTVVTRGPCSPLAQSAMAELEQACVLFQKASVYSIRATKALPILTKLSEKARNVLAAAQSEHTAMSVDKGEYWNIKQEDTEDELSIFAGHTRFVNAKRSADSTNTSPPQSIQLEPSPPLYNLSSPADSVPTSSTRSLGMPPLIGNIPSSFPPPSIALASPSNGWGPPPPLRSSEQYIPSPTTTDPHSYNATEQTSRHLPLSDLSNPAYVWPLGSSQQPYSAPLPTSYHLSVYPDSYPSPESRQPLQHHQQYHVQAIPIDPIDLHPPSVHAAYASQYPPQQRHPIPPLVTHLQQLRQSLSQAGSTAKYAQFRKPDRKALALSANHRINSELYATLLGHLANVRFISVTDRFLAELMPVANGQVPKDMATKYENLIKGLKHITIKVWPPEAFEEGAEFMESLSKSYAHAHGHLKIAFAETLVTLLHPIGKTAQAETNNPQWGKAIETIFPRAREMTNKPRYWPVAFPLAVTSLCVAPQAYFLKHWHPFFDRFVSKIKEKPYRVMVMNGLLRLVWTYLYRCQESASTTMSKLEGVLKHFFPLNRTTVLPADDYLEPLTYIMHFILSRHPEYGRELCLELMQEAAIITQQQKSGSIGSVLAPERSAIAFNAILLSLHNMEREILTPTWPSSSDFTVVPPKLDYVSSSEYLAIGNLKPGMQDFLNRCGSALAAMAVHCGNAVGHMSVFDEQWSYARLNPAFEESSNFLVRRHADGITVAYPAQSYLLVSLLNTCFQAWPRLLHPSLSITDAVDMLLQGVIHVEPVVAESAGAALKRFMADETNAMQVVAQFNVFLFSPSWVCYDAGFRLHIEYSPLLRLWVEVVDDWIREIMKKGLEVNPQAELVLAKLTEVEAASLFLLSHDAPVIHSAGVRVIRLLGNLSSSIASSSSTAGSSPSPLYITERLQGKRPGHSGLHGYDDLLDKSEQSRLEQWRKFKGEEVALRIADSTNEKDRKLWRYVYPAILQDCLKYTGPTLGFLREAIVAVVSRYHPYISYLGGLSSRQPPGLPSRSPLDRDGLKQVLDNKGLIDQWHMWVKILCSTAVPPDSSRPALTKLGRDHSRTPSDVSFERERYMTTRGLFRHLTPFLDSENASSASIQKRPRTLMTPCRSN